MPNSSRPVIHLALLSLLALAAAGAACNGGSLARDADGAGTEGEVEPDGPNDGEPDGRPEAEPEAVDSADAETAREGDASPDDGAEDAEAEAVEPFRIDPHRILDDIAELTSDPYEGRLAGSTGGARALDFAEARFESLGLDGGGDDGFRQPFRFQQWGPTAPPGLTFDGEALDEGTGFGVMQYSGSATVTAEVVFAGYGLTVPPYSSGSYPGCPLATTGYDDYAGIDVTDKIVLVFRHGPADDEAVHDGCPGNEACTTTPCLWNFGYKAANARLHGAAAILVVQDYREGPEIVEGGTLGADGYFADFAALTVERTAVERHVSDLRTWAAAIDGPLQPDSHETGIMASVSVDTARVTVDTANLIAVAPGTDPTLAGESVVVGAHIDHLGIDPGTGEMYRGADDNASGSAVVLELARGMAESGVVPARTVVLALFNAEEEGLIGSCYYVDNPAYAIDAVRAMFSLDMVGAGNGTGLALYGTTERGNAWIAELMDAAATEAGLSYRVAVADPLELSDHVCFSYAGVPNAFASTLGPHSYYHTPADTVETIPLEDVQAAAELMWATLVPLARGTEDSYLGGKRARVERSPADLPDLSRLRTAR